jgi:hypothetical protein
MATFWMLRSRRAPDAALVVWGTGLLAAATVFRVLSAFHSPLWLLVAAGCWSAVFGLLLVLFWRNRRGPIVS